VAFGTPRRQRQDRIEPIEGLNRRFLVDAEHHGVLRRIEVQADHIGGLRFELGIGRPHVPLESMGLQAGMLPGARDNRVLHAQLPTERPRGPVRRAVRRGATRPRHDARLQGWRQDGRLRAAMTGRQSGEAVLREPLLPQGDRPRAAAGHRGDRGVAAAVGQQQNDARAARRIRSTTARTHARFEIGSLGGRQHKRCRWHAPSYDLQLVSTSH
jgi:hypothetical protein